MIHVYQVQQLYELACQKITAAIRASNIKVAVIAEQVGISKERFYQRMRYNEWTPELIQKIALLLCPDERLTIGGPEGNL